MSTNADCIADELTEIAAPNGWRNRPEVQAQFFKDLDQGSKGYLVFEDLQPLLSQEYPTQSDEDLQILYGKIDKNSDGHITIQEFEKFFFDIEAATTMALETTKSGLVKAACFTRIRPAGTAAAGPGHVDQHVEQGKKLEQFDAESLTVSGKKYTFPVTNLTPEKTQDEVYEATMPALVDAWIQQMRNCMFFAYGQTGTGKTHTLFGTSESLKSDAPHPDWGIFPRVVHTCLERCKAVSASDPSCRFVLTVSALEFYLCQAFDLLHSPKVPICIDVATGKPLGAKQMILEKTSDVAPFLEQVYGNRTVMATKMNEGSSRAHTALILTFHQCGDDEEGICGMQGKELYCATTFTIMDLAGSERPGKTGGERYDPGSLILAMSKGYDCPVGAQGQIINFELTTLCTEVITATEQHDKKKKYIPPKRGVSDMIKFSAPILNGQALLGLVICISQASQNGWETWFSCEMGAKLAKLKAPVMKEKGGNLHEFYRKALAAADKAEKLAKETPEKGPAARYKPMRVAGAAGAREVVAILEKLGATDFGESW